MTGTPDLDGLARSMPFARMIGVDLVAASADEVVATDVVDDDGHLMARVTQTQAVLDAR